MDWEDGPAPGEEQQVEVDAVVLNHHAPSQHTARQQKGNREVLSTAELEERALTLEAWAPLYAGEPEALRLERERAGRNVWEHLSCAIRDTLEGGDLRVFDDLLWFARMHHPGSAAEQEAAACTDAGGDGDSDAEHAELGAAAAPLEDEASEAEEEADAFVAAADSDYAQVPTGLVLAGGVNSADHAATFPNLAAHLRAGGCYAALLSLASFGRSPSEALNAMLCQLAGLDSRAGDWAALAA